MNKIGALDVDIIIDEGPDSITMMADALDTLQSAMANGTAVPASVIYELLPIPDSMKRKLIGLTQQASQPSPEQQQAQQLELAQASAKVNETNSKAMLNQAKAQEASQPEQPQGQKYDVGPSWAEMEQMLAAAHEKHASADLKRAQTHKTMVEADLAPHAIAQKAAADQARLDQMRQRPQ